MSINYKTIISNDFGALSGKTIFKTAEVLKANSVTIISTFIAGLLSYMFIFSNKLVNHDEICCMFSKGGSIASGRWGMEFMEFLFPNFSMPWIYGIISISFVAATCCFIMNIFNINNRICQIILSGLIVTFPSFAGIFSYMFTSTSYALAFFLSVLSVYLITLKKFRYITLSVFALVISLSIYQAYIAVSASLLIVLLIQSVLNHTTNESTVFKNAIKYFCVLISSIVAYIAISTLVFFISGTFFSEYAQENLSSNETFLQKIILTYITFFDIFFGEFSLMDSLLITIVHFAATFITGFGILLWAIHNRNIKQIILLALFIGLLPLSVCSILLIVSYYSVHTLMMYSFISLYVLSFVVIQSVTKPLKVRHFLFNSVCILTSVVLINNIYVANREQLKMHLAYENTFSFYSSIVSAIKSTPDFDAQTKVALVGSSNEKLTDFSEYFTAKGFVGARDNRLLINSYSREAFIKYYIGFDIEFASEEEIDNILNYPEFKEMPIYPYYGSIQKINNFIVIKLSEENNSPI